MLAITYQSPMKRGKSTFGTRVTGFMSGALAQPAASRTANGTGKRDDKRMR